MRSVMRACIGSNRAPDGRYAEIDLPASPYRLLNALDEIGIKSTKEIVYQEILNYGSFGYLEPHFDEYTMLEELNALAQKLAVFDRVDSIAFEGLVKMAEQKPEPFGVKELINFAHSTESCHVVSDVFDDEQLGRFYAGNGFMPEYETLPDKIYEHLDFAKIGREARESEGGVFTQRGYRRCTWTSHGYRNMHPLYPVQSKKNSPPPMKGTKRYRKEQKRAAKKARRQSIAHVLTLIENLDTQARVARSM